MWCSVGTVQVIEYGRVIHVGYHPNMLWMLRRDLEKWGLHKGNHRRQYAWPRCSMHDSLESCDSTLEMVVTHGCWPVQKEMFGYFATLVKGSNIWEEISRIHCDVGSCFKWKLEFSILCKIVWLALIWHGDHHGQAMTLSLIMDSVTLCNQVGLQIGPRWQRRPNCMPARGYFL